jgi:hypothetical protein
MRNLSFTAEPVQELALLGNQFGQPRFMEQGRSKMQRD